MRHRIMHQSWVFGFFATLGLAACVPMACVFAAEGEAYTSPEEAPADFAFQGEFRGKLGEYTLGVALVSLGDGKFKSTTYRGGLPGDEKFTAAYGEPREVKMEEGVLNFTSGDFEVSVTPEALTLKRGQEVVGELEKVVRRSYTLGKKPPEGAIVLFDGTSTDEWKNAKLVEDMYLGATGCYTKRKFGDHTLHLEFRTPYMPDARGQGRGNSGVYVQSRYEIQVLDSFGLEAKDNDCGGIYQISKPAVNMCYPPLSWQTYDIDFTAARYDTAGNKVSPAKITVMHNGVVIHDNLALPRHTPGRFAEADSPESLFLQDHGNPVVYRNIWVVEKSDEN